MNDLLEILKDKKQVIKFILETIDKNQNACDGIRKISGKDNINYKLTKTMEVVANQSLQIKSLSLLLLVYTQSDSFDIDIAKMLAKMGKGDEALKQMFKNKMEGIV